LATLAAAKNEKYLKGYGPDVDGFDQVAFGNLNEVRAKVGPETAAILIEPVQGEGGMRAADVQFLKDLRTVCDEFGLLLMFDEVQCGMGRTGKLFAHEWAGVKPDIVSTAKAIGGGFPLGACLATEKVAAAFGHGSHGTTFGGGPLAMAVGNAVLDVMLAPGFLDNVAKMGRLLDRHLNALVKQFPSVFSEARGIGLIRGLKAVGSNAAIVDQARAGGLLILTAADNVVRLLPPLIVSEAEIERAMGILTEAAAQAKAA
jgi:acetylornithine/N-succinyldiaminopimelate aminotransferase